MAFTTTGKNEMLDALGALATRMRLLDGAAAEIVDHEDSSQDQAISWGAAASAELAMSGTCEFEVKSGVTVRYISFRSTDGITEYGRDELAEGDRETYANDGTYTVTAATLSITDPA